MEARKLACYTILMMMSVFIMIPEAKGQDTYETNHLGLIYAPSWLSNFGEDLRRDICTYIQPCNLIILGDFFIAGAVFANTNLDRIIRNTWQEDFRTKDLDNFFQPFKFVGGLSFWYFPIYLGAMGLGYTNDECLFGNLLYYWGYRSLRAMIIGGAQQLAFSPVLGSGRPIKHESSKWQPFRHINGISGHAFFGAVPIITAALMTDDLLLRYTFFALSTLPGLSRIESDSHYFSQVLLGWGLAYLSAKAVYNSDLSRPVFQICPYPKGVGVYARWEF